MSLFDKFKDVFKKTKDIAEDKLKDVSEVVVEKAGDLKAVVSEKMEDMPEIIANAKEKANKTAENLKEVVSEKLDDANAALDNMKAKAEGKKESFSFPEDMDTDISSDIEISNVVNEPTEVGTESTGYNSDNDILDLLPLEKTAPTTTDLTVHTSEQTDEIGALIDMETGIESAATEVKEGIQDQAIVLLEDSDDALDMAIDKAKDINRTFDIDHTVDPLPLPSVYLDSR